MPAVNVALACPMRGHCFEPPCSTRNLAVLPQSTIPSSRNSTSAERSETKRRTAPPLDAADTRNAVPPNVRLCPTACPTGPEFSMAKPNSSGTIIRVSGVRVPPPALRQGPAVAALWRTRGVPGLSSAELSAACSDRYEELRTAQSGRALMAPDGRAGRCVPRSCALVARVTALGEHDRERSALSSPTCCNSPAGAPMRMTFLVSSARRNCACACP